MKIAVCIKQVPDTTDVKINPETNTLIREGVASITNPFDEYAVEEALLIKEKHGGEVHVISMGPPQAIEVFVPAFVISELNTAFQIGFLIYIPFLIIDMVVASVLLSMGMMMLPPVMVSLPFKLLLFVLVDGWYLIIGSLVQSFH